MLNDVKSADIKKRLIEAAEEGVNIKTKISFEIARREDTIEGLKRQMTKEREEIDYLSNLDPIELKKEEVRNGRK